jgi:hypothetical protein
MLNQFLLPRYLKLETEKHLDRWPFLIVFFYLGLEVLFFRLPRQPSFLLPLGVFVPR